MTTESKDTSKKARSESKDDGRTRENPLPGEAAPLPGDPPVQSPPEPDQNDPAIWNPERIGEAGDESDPDGRGGRVREAEEQRDNPLSRDEIRDRARDKAEEHAKYGV